MMNTIGRLVLTATLALLLTSCTTREKVGIEDEDARVSERAVWALEAALNRFLLIAEKFGESAAVASDADCGRWDAYLIESVAQQALDASHPEDASGGDAAPSSAPSSFVQDGDPSRVRGGLRFGLRFGRDFFTVGTGGDLGT